MKDLYPPINAYESRYLDVGDGHSVYVEECGNPAGTPVVFLHGGPGAGCEMWQRQFFNPERYRIILFDQRGCGRSRPHACLTDNTTQHLIADMELIRESLEVDRWVVFGGSWGSTLGLIYAQTHPQNCLGLILRGIFLCRDKDIQWFYQSGANRLFPDFWADFARVIPKEEHGDMVGAYYRRLTDADEAIRMEAAQAWSSWEGRTLNLEPMPSVIESFTNPHTALSIARLECHYFINHIFMPEDGILAHAEKLHDIPGVIVHGRYDVVCPMDQAYALHRRWPQARLHIVQKAGHAANEPGIVHHLVDAADGMVE